MALCFFPQAVVCRPLLSSSPAAKVVVFKAKAKAAATEAATVVAATAVAPPPHQLQVSRSSSGLRQKKQTRIGASGFISLHSSRRLSLAAAK